MKQFIVYISSHCEAPDYEDWTLAENKEEAIRNFLTYPALQEWDRSTLEPFVGEE